MEGRLFPRVIPMLVTACALMGFAVHANAQTMVEYSSEARFQLDMRVPDAAVLPYLPAGWTLNVATEGGAKDTNLRLEFTDRVTINGPDGKPVAGAPTSRTIYLAVPVKTPSGEAAQLVIGGLTDDPGNAPGPFGVYLLATTHTMQRTTSSDGAGPTLDSQDWVFAAPTGERLEMHLKYQRGVGNKTMPADTKYYSAKNPSFYQTSKQEQVLDDMRNMINHPPDHVKEFSLKVGGGSYAKLFDGKEQPMSWDNIIWINRTVFLP